MFDCILLEAIRIAFFHTQNTTMYLDLLSSGPKSPFDALDAFLLVNRGQNLAGAHPVLKKTEKCNQNCFVWTFLTLMSLQKRSSGCHFYETLKCLGPHSSSSS